VTDRAAPVSPADGPRAAARRPAPLVGLLAFASGGVDAVTLMTLGGAFTSVITGNLVFVGRAVGTSSLTPALDAVTAVAGYMAGVAVGARLAHVAGRRAAAGARPMAWPARATIVLAAEAVILVAVNLAWVLYRTEPPSGAVYVMLAAAALALGMQGAAARAIAGAPSTTYMTGALTTLIEALATGRRKAVDVSALYGLPALIAGAAVGAVLVTHAKYFALLPPLVAVLLVVAVKARHHRAEAAARDSQAEDGELVASRPS
jgi:uncharacterized membrane protein YoaK (UPF0700 family)